jgi:transposase
LSGKESLCRAEEKLLSRVSGRSSEDGDRDVAPDREGGPRLGINPGTLGNWVNAYRREHAGEEAPLSVNERARLRELEREARDLRMENEFLKKAAAYFAMDHR